MSENRMEKKGGGEEGEGGRRLDDKRQLRMMEEELLQLLFLPLQCNVLGGRAAKCLPSVSLSLCLSLQSIGVEFLYTGKLAPMLNVYVH